VGLHRREGEQLLPSLQHILSPILHCLFYFIFCHLKYHAMISLDCLETLVLLHWVLFPGSLPVPGAMLSSAANTSKMLMLGHPVAPSRPADGADSPFSAALLPRTGPPVPAAGSGQTLLPQIRPQIRPCAPLASAAQSQAPTEPEPLLHAMDVSPSGRSYHAGTKTLSFHFKCGQSPSCGQTSLDGGSTEVVLPPWDLGVLP